MSGWLISNMTWATAAMLVVLAVRKPFGRLFGAGPAYALWIVPALRLIMPPLPSVAPSLHTLVPAETLVVFVGDTAAPLPPDGGPGQWVPLLLAIWAGGAAAFLFWQWLGYRRFLSELGRSARCVGAHGGLPLIESAAVNGPLALGLLDRRIVVPADFRTRYSAPEQRLALDHESIHHRRGDIWWNHLGLAILALNWFNPVAWFAFRAFRADQELACDARVTAAADADARQDYARALIKSASRPGLIAACPLNHADQLKRRLRMMKTHSSSRARMLAGTAAIVGLGALSLAFAGPVVAQTDAATATPPATAAAPATGQRHEERVIIRTERHGESTSTSTSTERHGDAPPIEHRERVIIMNHGGPGDHAHGDASAMHHGATEVIVPSCEGGQRDEINEGTENNRTRIILCNRGEATPAQRVERLQHARDRIAADSELSAEQKARILALLDQHIAAMRAQ